LLLQESLEFQTVPQIWKLSAGDPVIDPLLSSSQKLRELRLGSMLGLPTKALPPPRWLG
jgi:hypothetical protein